MKILFLLVCFYWIALTVEGQYYGTEIGAFTQNDHEVQGTVYIVDERRLLVRNFHYDGSAPDAFFWAGERGVSSSTPDRQGTRLLDSTGSGAQLYQHVNADVLLTLPDGKTVRDYQWLAVWCRMAGANFGHVLIGDSLVIPAPQTVTPITNSIQVNSGDVQFLDDKRIRLTFTQLITDQVAELFFYAGTDDVNPANAHQVPDETGSMDKLGEYLQRTIDLTLPGQLTTADISWIVVSDSSLNVPKWRVGVPSAPVPPYTETGYYGISMGRLSQKNNLVRGNVHVVDNNRLWIRLFNYDGQCAGAQFHVGLKGQHSDNPGSAGMQIANEGGSFSSLGEYTDASVILTLPGDVVVPAVNWISVWCTSSQTDLGSYKFPPAVVIPNAVSLGEFSRLAHSVRSGPVHILDKQRFRIQDFHYDGYGPDAFFLVDTGPVTKSGQKIPDENGSRNRPGSGGYSGETLELRLPVGLTVDDIDYLTLFCIAYNQNFGNVNLPETSYTVSPYIPPPMVEPVANCETMSDSFNVGWEVMGNEIMFEFTGNLGNTDGYMAFGVSGSDTRSGMLGSDPMVVYLENGLPKIQDYTINQYSLCSGSTGVCPDTAHSGSQDLTTIMASHSNGITTLRFTRPLDTGDSSTDKATPISGDTYIVWAMGNVNDQNQVTIHTTRISGNMQINFGRSPAYNCQPIQMVEEEPKDPWTVPGINGMDVKEITAYIGPTGGEQGYRGITGQVSWGISWYLNGLLIPELTVRRGDTYTFIVNGGDDTSNQAKYHPFYITDDPIGGYASKTEQEKQMVHIYAGTTDNNNNGIVGSYCEYVPEQGPMDLPNSFEEFAETLTLKCDGGAANPGTFMWTPDENTPDLVYYQCFTHNYLGWKIHVVDDYNSGASPVCVLPVYLVLGIIILLRNLL